MLEIIILTANLKRQMTVVSRHFLIISIKSGFLVKRAFFLFISAKIFARNKKKHPILIACPIFIPVVQYINVKTRLILDIF